MIPEKFQSIVKPEGVSYPITFNTVDGMLVLKSGGYIVVLKVCNQRHFVETRREENRIWWVSAPLRMRYTISADSKAIYPAQAIKQSELINNSRPIVWPIEKSTDTMQTLVSYARTFKKYYKLKFYIFYLA